MPTSSKRYCFQPQNPESAGDNEEGALSQPVLSCLAATRHSVGCFAEGLPASFLFGNGREDRLNIVNRRLRSIDQGPINDQASCIGRLPANRDGLNT